MAIGIRLPYIEEREEAEMKRYPKTKNATLRKTARIKSVETRAYYAMGRVWRVAL